MRLRVFTRLLAAAGAVLLAGPVFAQSADLGVTLKIDEPNAANTGFPIGGAKKFTATITNPDATLVTEVTLDATFAAPLEVDPASVTGCKEITADTGFPCTISVPAPGFQSGATVDVTFDVVYPAPKKSADLPTTCPTTATTYAVTTTITGAKSGAATVTDGNAANNADTKATFLREFADLEVTSFDGPANVGEGQTVQYTAAITNHGPCAAQNVRATLGPPATLVFAGEVGAACTNGAAGFEPRNRCELGTIASGASTSFTASYTVQTFPKSVTHAAIPIDVTVASRSTGTTVRAIDDPYQDNTTSTPASANSGSTQATVDLKNGGCATGGAGTLLGLLSLVALRLRRRKA